ncbi:MAG: phytoene/squalene synthase family protein [Sphingopyxis sp.]
MTGAAPLDRAALVAFARHSMARGSQSFGAASRLFDRRTRERAWLLYAWARACDDLADGQDHGGAMVPDDAQVAARLEQICALTNTAWAGVPTGHAAFDCLAVLMHECPIPRIYVDAMLDGFRRDADGWRPRSEADLFSYCWNVAGSVGCMMAIVMGVDPARHDVLDRACDLGLAFQLANIARDVAEDAAADRCYLPMDWLVEMDIPPGQHMHPAYRHRLAIMAKWLAEFADAHAASAQIGALALPVRSRWAVLCAAGIYGDIGHKVRAAGDHAWDHRQHTSRAEKWRHAGHALVAALFHQWQGKPPRQAVMRDGLWTRPQG